MNKNYPFFSLIIPVYNTEKYLRRCLDSVVNQTFKDIEIIIVNDCSPQNCDEIVSEYNDERIIYIKHNINKGLLLARKTGNIKASGKYIIYIDSDDEADINMCYEVYKEYKNKEADIIHFGVKCIIDESLYKNKKESDNALKNIQFRMSLNNFYIQTSHLLHELASGKINHNVWGKAYKKQLIKKITNYVPNIKLINAEDLLYSLMIFYFSKSYSCLNKKLYYYYISIGESNKNTSNLSLEQYSYLCECSSAACFHFLEFLKEHKTDCLYGIYYYNCYYNQYIFLKKKIVDNGDKDLYLNVLNKYFDINIINNYLNFKKYEDEKLLKKDIIIEKLMPYFFSIIISEYYIKIRIFGIKINLKSNICIKNVKIISFNSLLKNIFSIKYDKNDKYIKIFFLKIKLI